MNENLNTKSEAEVKSQFKSWRMRIFFTVWITYMIYYIGRTNISIAKPFIMSEYGISATVMGLVGTTFFLAYAFGQFVNGFLGDKIGARRFIAIGLIVSSVINLFMGTAFDLIWVAFLFWGLNGYFQSMGWAPSVKTIANWYPAEDRGKWSSRLATSYLLGGVVSWIIAIVITKSLSLNWRFSFIVPGIIMLILAIHFYARCRNAPEEVGLPTIEEECEGQMVMGECRDDEFVGFKYTVKTVLFTKTVLFASFGLFCLNMVRYGLTDWLPYLLSPEVTGTSIFGVWKSIFYPLGGLIGVLLGAWISDKFAGKRRIPVICAFFILLSLVLLIYTVLPPLDLVFGIPVLILIGILNFAPHALLVSTIPMEFATRKAASAATGFIDGWGYIGAAITTFTSGALIDTAGSWAAFLLWVIIALIGGLVLLLDWKSLPERKEYL
ncbi:MAG: MFS transporter [Candidatus Lokiarchaeota archaeon]|nr:MFS transporter [Candidatus Lokiarchaeota archaeon]